MVGAGPLGSEGAVRSESSSPALRGESRVSWYLETCCPIHADLGKDQGSTSISRGQGPVLRVRGSNSFLELRIPSCR